jgi:hypothetical protein
VVLPKRPVLQGTWLLARPLCSWTIRWSNTLDLAPALTLQDPISKSRPRVDAEQHQWEGSDWNAHCISARPFFNNPGNRRPEALDE